MTERAAQRAHDLPRRIALPPSRLLCVPVLLAAIFLVSACDEVELTAAATETPASVAVAPPASTASTPSATTLTPPQNLAVDVDRIMHHIEHLAVTIGIRPAGTAQERAAAEYIADVLRDQGYQAAIEDFSFDVEVDESSVTVPGNTLPVLAMDGSPNAEVHALLQLGGRGRASDLEGVDLHGRIAVFDRGMATFADMARLAHERGAVAVIVVNNQEGPFRGTLGGQAAAIPIVSVELRHRDELHEARGIVTLRTALGQRTTQSQNVVATVNGRCEGYLGAHYDSVPQGPGANDNASGTAVILEVARVALRPGLCVVAFGAEEVGLYGSRAYVEQHFVGAARFMLNVDMAGRLDGPIIVGDPRLRADIFDALDAAGMDSPLRPGSFPPFASSDHVSFDAVGVPAVTFNSGDDELIHTAGDTIERILPEALQAFADAVSVAIDALLPAPAPAGVR